MVDVTNFSWVTPLLMSLVSNAFFWAALIIIALVLMIIGMKIKKKRRLKISVIKITDLGNNKVGFNETKAGYFKKEKKFFGLWETGGEEELVTKQDEVIYGAAPDDYHDFNYVRTLFVTPSIDDPKILVPISKVNFSQKSKDMLFEIAPIEIREAAVDAHKKTIKEMKDFKEQIVQWIIIGLFFIVAFLTILFITQYGKHMADTAAASQQSAQSTLVQIGQKLVDAVNANNANHAASSSLGGGGAPLAP